MHSLHILQPYSVSHLLCHSHLLACPVDKPESCLWEHYRERYAGEPSAASEIKHSRAGPETQGLGYGERVKDMVLVEIVNILARDDIYLRVPVMVESVELSKLPLLLVGEVFEVF